jgi:hypothetical protein
MACKERINEKKHKLLSKIEERKDELNEEIDENKLVQKEKKIMQKQI